MPNLFRGESSEISGKTNWDELAEVLAVWLVWSKEEVWLVFLEREKINYQLLTNYKVSFDWTFFYEERITFFQIVSLFGWKHFLKIFMKWWIESKHTRNVYN